MSTLVWDSQRALQMNPVRQRASVPRTLLSMVHIQLFIQSGVKVLIHVSARVKERERALAANVFHCLSSQEGRPRPPVIPVGPTRIQFLKHDVQKILQFDFCSLVLPLFFLSVDYKFHLSIVSSLSFLGIHSVFHEDRVCVLSPNMM